MDDSLTWPEGKAEKVLFTLIKISRAGRPSSAFCCANPASDWATLSSVLDSDSGNERRRFWLAMAASNFIVSCGWWVLVRCQGIALGLMDGTAAEVRFSFLLSFVSARGDGRRERSFQKPCCLHAAVLAQRIAAVAVGFRRFVVSGKCTSCLLGSVAESELMLREKPFGIPSKFNGCRVGGNEVRPWAIRWASVRPILRLVVGARRQDRPTRRMITRLSAGVEVDSRPMLKRLRPPLRSLFTNDP